VGEVFEGLRPSLGRIVGPALSGPHRGPHRSKASYEHFAETSILPIENFQPLRDVRLGLVLERRNVRCVVPSLWQYRQQIWHR
jgi:hypothetical protein